MEVNFLLWKYKKKINLSCEEMGDQKYQTLDTNLFLQ